MVSREQFDQFLLQSAGQRGAVVQDGEAVEHVLPTRDEVIVRTSRAEYRAKILIAADGANSTVRARLGLGRAGRVIAAMVDINDFDVRAHPSLRYDPQAVCSRQRVLLVGDAAGVDPLFGEGISAALAQGIIAAQCTLDALRKNDFSFSTYESRIRGSAIGSMMYRRYVIARRLYSHPKLAQFFTSPENFNAGHRAAESASIEGQVDAGTAEPTNRTRGIRVATPRSTRWKLQPCGKLTFTIRGGFCQQLCALLPRAVDSEDQHGLFAE